MEILNQSYSIISGLSPMEHIEMIGRKCYKSEDRIGYGTDRKFVSMLFKSNHLAMLEHYRFIMQVQPNIYEVVEEIRPRHFEMTNDGRCIISTNARAIIELPVYYEGIIDKAKASGIRDVLVAAIVNAFDCYELFGVQRDDECMMLAPVDFIPNNKTSMTEYEYKVHGWKSVGFVTDRGISHEIVRHREETSFAQESTRYCNYNSGKFGGGITVIDQGFSDKYQKSQWIIACSMAEDVYNRLLSVGVKPQMARSVLPTCLKTEIVVTAPMYEWEHIFNLRVRGTTGAPHPMIKELMKPLMEELENE